VKDDTGSLNELSFWKKRIISVQAPARSCSRSGTAAAAAVRRALSSIRKLTACPRLTFDQYKGMCTRESPVSCSRTIGRYLSSRGLLPFLAWLLSRTYVRTSSPIACLTAVFFRACVIRSSAKTSVTRPQHQILSDRSIYGERDVDPKCVVDTRSASTIMLADCFFLSLFRAVLLSQRRQTYY
jgi:hypothetical protein